MEFRDAKCPNCGGALQLPDNLKTAKCIYCGTDITVRDAINAAGPSAENLLKRALFAAEANNLEEAYDYYTRVLEYDPQNYVAQLGKAEMAGRLSTKSRFREEELIRGAEEAVAVAPDDKKESVRRQAAEMICRVCIDYSELLDRFKYEEVCMQRVSAINCLGTALTYAPDDPLVLDVLVAEFATLRYTAEVRRIELNQEAKQKLVNPDKELNAAYDKAISHYHRMTHEYLSRLHAAAPARAARRLNKEREFDQRIQKMRSQGCLAVVAFILLLATAALCSMPT